MKKFKVLITKKNSPWGIIVRPIADNVYKHIINFPDPTKRDEFINEQLFYPGDNYKTLFNSIKHIGNPRSNEQELNFRISIDTYKSLGYKFDDLINKDYAILEIENEDTSKQYLFYQIACKTFSPSEDGMIEFDGILDIFFTYPPKFRPESKNLVERMHTKRYDENGFLFETNNAIESLDFEKSFKIKESKFKRDDIENLNISEEGKKFLYETQWLIGYLKPQTLQTKLNISGNKGSELPYGICFIPFIKSNQYKIKLENFPGSFNEIVEENWHQNILGENLNSANLLSVHLLAEFPFSYNDFTIAYSGGTILFKMKTPSNFSVHQDTAAKKVVRVNILNNTNIFFRMDLISPKLKTYTDLREIDNEVKLFTGQFFSKLLINSQSEGYEVALDYLKGDAFSYRYSFSPEKYIVSYTPVDLYSADESYAIFTREGFVITDIIEYPLENDPYSNYISQNRISSKTGVLGGLLGVAGGLGLSYLGSKKGGKQGASMQNAGNFLAFTSGVNLLNTLGSRADNLYKPSTPKNATTDIIYNCIVSQDVRIYDFVLAPKDRITVYDFFYKNGYLVEELHNIDTIKSTRYYFNFVKAEDVFNTIDLQVSSEIKQLIGATFRDGITLWHYRDKNTWKGILNYTYENIEMDNIPLIGRKNDKKIPQKTK